MNAIAVTGGARGIGRGVAATFQGKGWQVVIVDADGAAAAATARELGVDHVTADVADRTALRAAFTDMANRHGPLDALVTCAGITRIGPSADLHAEDWRAVVDVDLTGTFFACQAAYPVLRDGAAIVTIASIAAFRGLAERAAYCAAKAGVVALTRSLAVEWAPRRIRVNCVAPGWVDTPFLRSAAERGHVDLEELATRPPLHRIASVEDVVGSIAFLISGAAGFVTGQTICVDGGWVWAG